MLMRARILKLLLVSMLFVSVEGVADAVDELSFHQSHHSHADDTVNKWFPDTDGNDHVLDNCEHFCHGHTVGLVGQLVLAAIPEHEFYALTPPVEATSQYKAPPIPPPNILS